MEDVVSNVIPVCIFDDLVYEGIKEVRMACVVHVDYDMLNVTNNYAVDIRNLVSLVLEV